MDLYEFTLFLEDAIEIQGHQQPAFVVTANK